MGVMESNDRRRLKTPQGTEGFFHEEAYRHRQLLRLTEDHFTSWGYLPVLTPVFDYYETYRSLINREQEERTYRFPDRDGELLILRSDITLFLAKQMGLTMKEDSPPRRVWYADSILRHQEEEDISSDEFFQSGAELLGLEGRDADLEILMMLHDLLEAMRLPTWRLHIGSRAVLDCVLDGRADAFAAGRLLEIRDRDGMRRLLSDASIPDAERLADLLLFLGTPEEFSSAVPDLSRGLDDSIGKALKELNALASDFSRAASEEKILIDLSEHGGQPYYTGFTVRAFVEGANAAVASGGRYDDLLGAFGPKIPAAGFCLLMRKIEPLSGFAAQAVLSDPITAAAGDDFQSRYSNAVTRRRSGQRVVLTEGTTK